MVEIKEYEDADRDEVIQLVLHCQNDGTRPIVSVEDQPELLHIPKKYFSAGGCFWVEKEDGRVIGSIGLMNLGNGIGALKKFFVYEDYRGAPYHLGRKLYNKVLSFIQKHDFSILILDRPCT